MAPNHNALPVTIQPDANEADRKLLASFIDISLTNPELMARAAYTFETTLTTEEEWDGVEASRKGINGDELSAFDIVYSIIRTGADVSLRVDESVDETLAQDDIYLEYGNRVQDLLLQKKVLNANRRGPQTEREKTIDRLRINAIRHQRTIKLGAIALAVGEHSEEANDESTIPQHSANPAA